MKRQTPIAFTLGLVLSLCIAAAPRVTIDEAGTYDLVKAVTTPPTTQPDPDPAPPTTQPDPEPLPPLGEFPNEDNTGPYDEEALQPMSASAINKLAAANGAVIKNFVSENDDQIYIKGNNVTLENFRVINPRTTGAAIKFASNDLKGGVISFGEIRGGRATNAVSGSNYVARRLHVHAMQADCFRVKANVLITESYLHDFARGPNAHGDGVQMYPTGEGSGNIRVIGNTIDARGGNAVCFQVNNGWRIEANYLLGGNYTIQCGGERGTVIVNNTFGGGPKLGLSKYGPIRVGSGDRELVTWEGNRWEKSGEPVALK